VIEDDDDLRELLRRDLSRAGYEVDEYPDAALALQTMEQEHAPDLIILDLMMPGMDGWQFRVEQRKRAALATVPVIAITGNRSAYAEAFDADALLRKPLAFDELERTIEIVLLAAERARLLGKAVELERVQSLGMLAASVAHEINNPLVYVLGCLTMAEEAFLALLEQPAKLAELGPAVLRDIRAARDGAERVASVSGLINAFLRGRTKSELQDIDPMRAVDAAVRMASHEVAKRAQLIRDLRPLPHVLADEARLAQVCLNLLVNAAQAIPEHHPAEHTVTIRTYTADEKAFIEVEDDGQGMTEDVAARIFEPFFTTKPPGTGTGLGLSISREIIDDFSGTLSVTSTPGKGSTFRVELPALKSASLPAPRA
jgi:two-component system NtrC family sensor kinase